MPSRRAVILSLLFLATLLNYMDRIIFAVLMPVIRVDIPISNEEYGYLTAAFQLAYGVGNLIFGALVDAIGVRPGYALALAGWSLSAAAHAFARIPLHLGVCRGFLGLAEAGNFPAATKAIAEWYPKKDRAFAMGITLASTNLAAMIGPPLFVFMAAKWGWRVTFFAIGISGVAVAAAWLAAYKIPTAPNSEAAAQLPWRDALRLRQTWGFAIAKFFTDPVWWFYLFWLPLYFHDVRGLDLQQIGWALPVIYLLADAGAIAGGWLPGRLIRAGRTPASARKISMAVAVACMPIAALAPLASDTLLAIGLLSLGTAGHQGWSANLFTSVSDVFPPAAVASIIGIGQALASVGGFLFSSLLPGFVVDHFGYTPIFVLLGTFHLCGFAAVHFLMPGFTPIQKTEPS